MKKDWVVWVLCILIFLAGTTWGSISLKKDYFWRVDSVHDLFEILGVFGTFAAVLLGVVGLNTWKKQIKAGLDNELARRVLVSNHKYSQVVIATWRYADLAASHANELNRNGSIKEQSLFVDVVKTAYEDACDARADFLALQAECKAIWGDLLSNDVSELLFFEQICAQYLDDCYRCSLEENSPIIRARHIESASVFLNYFGRKGIINGVEAEAFVNVILLKINKKLEVKLIR